MRDKSSSPTTRSPSSSPQEPVSGQEDTKALHKDPLQPATSPPSDVYVRTSSPTLFPTTPTGTKGNETLSPTSKLQPADSHDQARQDSSLTVEDGVLSSDTALSADSQNTQPATVSQCKLSSSASRKRKASKPQQRQRKAAKKTSGTSTKLSATAARKPARKRKSKSASSSRPVQPTGNSSAKCHTKEATAASYDALKLGRELKMNLDAVKRRSTSLERYHASMRSPHSVASDHTFTHDSLTQTPSGSPPKIFTAQVISRTSQSGETYKLQEGDSPHSVSSEEPGHTRDEIRRKNRQAARSSRLRHKEFVANLEGELAQLKAKHRALLQQRGDLVALHAQDMRRSKERNSRLRRAIEQMTRQNLKLAQLNMAGGGTPMGSRRPSAPQLRTCLPLSQRSSAHARFTPSTTAFHSPAPSLTQNPLSLDPRLLPTQRLSSPGNSVMGLVSQRQALSTERSVPRSRFAKASSARVAAKRKVDFLTPTPLRCSSTTPMQRGFPSSLDPSGSTEHPPSINLQSSAQNPANQSNKRFRSGTGGQPKYKYNTLPNAFPTSKLQHAQGQSRFQAVSPSTNLTQGPAANLISSPGTPVVPGVCSSPVLPPPRTSSTPLAQLLNSSSIIAQYSAPRLTTEYYAAYLRSLLPKPASSSISGAGQAQTQGSPGSAMPNFGLGPLAQSNQQTSHTLSSLLPTGQDSNPIPTSPLLSNAALRSQLQSLARFRTDSQLTSNIPTERPQTAPPPVISLRAPCEGSFQLSDLGATSTATSPALISFVKGRTVAGFTTTTQQHLSSLGTTCLPSSSASNTQTVSSSSAYGQTSSTAVASSPRKAVISASTTITSEYSHTSQNETIAGSPAAAAHISTDSSSLNDVPSDSLESGSLVQQCPDAEMQTVPPDDSGVPDSALFGTANSMETETEPEAIEGSPPVHVLTGQVEIGGAATGSIPPRCVTASPTPELCARMSTLSVGATLTDVHENK